MGWWGKLSEEMGNWKVSVQLRPGALTWIKNTANETSRIKEFRQYDLLIKFA
jgi:hypothetical protein